MSDVTITGDIRTFRQASTTIPAVTINGELVAGARGPKGEAGETGQGVAVGGTTGQILSKASNADYDTEWADAGSGLGDMTKAIYDPNTVQANVYNTDNHIDGTTNKVYTATEKTKLSGIETSATADQTAGEIKTAYESNADTNAFTDAEKANLANQSGTNTGDQDISGIATNASAITTLQTTKQNILLEGAFVDGDKTKLNGIETAADVTDATNVTTALGTVPMSAHSDVDTDKYKTPTDGDVLTFDGTDWSAEVPAAGGQTPFTAIVDATGNGDYASLSAAIADGAFDVFIKNGSYTESSTITIAGRTNIRGESKQGVTITWTSGTSGLILSSVANAVHSRISNLTLVGHNLMTGAMIANAQQHLTVDNVHIHTVSGTGGDGVSTTANYLTVNNSYFYNIDGACVIGNTSTFNKITNNVFVQDTSNTQGDCGVQNPGYRSTVSNNVFYNFKNGSIKAGIYLTAANYGIVIDGNQFTSCTNPIYFGSTANVQYSTISNNMINACGAGGNAIYTPASATFDFNVISSNTIDDNDYGMQILGGDKNTITSNLVRGRYFIAPVAGSTGITVAGAGNIIADNLIEEYDNGIKINSGTSNRISLNALANINTTDIVDSGTTTQIIEGVIDEDTMSSNSVTKVPTQQSVKAYVDAVPTGATTLDGLTDVDTDKSKTPADGDVLTFDGTDWNAETPSAGGGAEHRATWDWSPWAKTTASADGTMIFLNSSGGASWSDNGYYRVNTGTTATSYGLMRIPANSVGNLGVSASYGRSYWEKNPNFWCTVTWQHQTNVASQAELAIVMGGYPNANSSDTNQVDSLGFKCVIVNGVGTVYAVSSNAGVGEQLTDVTSFCKSVNLNNAGYADEMAAIMTTGVDVKFYINGSLAATHTTYMPSGRFTSNYATAYAISDAGNTQFNYLTIYNMGASYVLTA